MIKNRLRVPILLALAFAFIVSPTACVKEDTGNCRGLRLHFEYTLNIQDEDRLASDVRDIRVYVFDKDNILSEIIRTDTYDLTDGYLDVDMEPGLYTAVAWAGGSGDLLAGGFMDAEMTDPATNQYVTPVRVGITTITDFRMMLKYTSLPDGIRGEIAPEADPFDNLFHACVENVAVQRGVAQVLRFGLMKNTNLLRVKINGLQYLEDTFAAPLRGDALAPGADQPLSVYVTGKNGSYTYDNRIGAPAYEVRYEPAYRYLDQTTMETDIKVLKLNVSQRTEDPVLLYITDPSTGLDLYPPINVVEAIMLAKEQNGNYVITSQEDLDRHDEFPIELNIDMNLGVSVSVFGYRVIFSGQDIQ